MAVKVVDGSKRISFHLSYEESLTTQLAINRDKTSLRQIIADGLTLYELTDHSSIRLFKDRLLSRLKSDRGVSRAFIVELRLLYLLLGHYLQKVED
jgi:hypothetical protein